MLSTLKGVPNMKIKIEYDSAWHNSFLSDVDKKAPQKQRKFVSTTKNKKEPVFRPISESTVLGILYRLIGDQRPLYKINKSEAPFFKDIQDKITFAIPENRRLEFQETVYLVNKGESRPSKKSFLGNIPDNAEQFFSKDAPQFWSVLFMDLESLLAFIVSDKVCSNRVKCNPTDILARIDELCDKNSSVGKTVVSLNKDLETLKSQLDKAQAKYKQAAQKHKNIKKPTKTEPKALQNAKLKYSTCKKELDDLINDKQRKRLDDQLHHTKDYLQNKYVGQSYSEENGNVFPINLYAAAINLQFERMQADGIFMDKFLTKKKTVIGFSKRGYNDHRDFINPLTGNGKKTTRTPFFALTKSSGVLYINIDVDRELAEQIASMILAVAVSTFYMGKKGLAYITDIRI